MIAGPPPESSLDGVSNLIGMFDVVSGGAEEPRELVVARVADVAADVAATVEVLLVRFLRSPTIVVHDERHDRDVVSDGGLELLGVHEKTPVPVDGDHRSLGTAELGAERGGKGEAQSAQIERREKRARLREVQAIITVRRGGSRVERHDRLRRQDTTKLRVDTLRLQGLRARACLRREPRVALDTQRLRFLPPGRLRVGNAVSGQRVQQSLTRFPRVRLYAERNRVVAPDITKVDVDLDERCSGSQVAVVELGRELSEP